MDKKHLNPEDGSMPLHGGDIYRHPVEMDFSVNTNPLGPPESMVRTLRGHCLDIVHYPDPACEMLRKAIASYEGVNTEHIICGNGAAELIYSLVQTIRPKKALLVEPAFSEYERSLKVAGTSCRYYICKRENNFRVKEDLLEYITSDLEMIFLCNPGNPIGEVIERELLKKVLDQAKRYEIPVLLDECFLDFLEDHECYEMLSYYREYPNVFVLKAFTKTFAMPGLRLGYGICCKKELLQQMEEGLPTWHVSLLAQVCGVEVLKDADNYLKETKEYLKREKNIVIHALEELGFHVYGSKANYIFFSIGKDENESFRDLYEQALTDKILIRDCSNYLGLSKGDYRIAIKSDVENHRLIRWLRNKREGEFNG